MEIGKRFKDSYPPEAALWCNENNAIIKKEDDYYVIVENDIDNSFEIAKAQRATDVENIVVTVDDMIFNGDEKSQERMARLVSITQALNIPLSTETTWVLADNTIATVTVSQLAQACFLASQEQTRIWTIPYEND